MDTYVNSSILKLELLINGTRIDKSALYGLGTIYKEYQYGYNDSNWINRQERQVIPSELILPGEIVVAPHLRPSSPFIIKRFNDEMYVIDERSDNIVSTIDYLKRPKIWDIELSDGSKLKKYLNVYGTNCLNLFIVAKCDFWDEGIPCAFCSLKPTQTFHKEVIANKQIDMIEEAISLAFEYDDNIEWMIVTGGSLKNRTMEIDRYCNVLNRIKKHIPSKWNGIIKGNAALLPSKSKKDLEKLHETGIEHPSFNMEVWGRKAFSQYCIGKDKYASFNSLIDSYRIAVDEWGEGKVWCNFVGGISQIEELKEGFRFMADIGVVPGANIFHLDPNAMGVSMGLKEPTEDYVLEMYEYLSSIYKEYNYKPFFNQSVLRNSLSNEVYNGWL